MTEPNYAKEFFLLTAKEGDCWHTFVYTTEELIQLECTECGLVIGTEIPNPNPTYDNPRDILKRMREYCGEKRYKKFCQDVFQEYFYEPTFGKVKYAIPMEYVLDPPALLQKAVEFVIKMKGEK